MRFGVVDPLLCVVEWEKDRYTIATVIIGINFICFRSVCSMRLCCLGFLIRYDAPAVLVMVFGAGNGNLVQGESGLGLLVCG